QSRIDHVRWSANGARHHTGPPGIVRPISRSVVGYIDRLMKDSEPCTDRSLMIGKWIEGQTDTRIKVMPAWVRRKNAADMREARRSGGRRGGGCEIRDIPKLVVRVGRNREEGPP